MSWISVTVRDEQLKQDPEVQEWCQAIAGKLERALWADWMCLAKYGSCMLGTGKPLKPDLCVNE